MKSENKKIILNAESDFAVDALSHHYNRELPNYKYMLYESKYQ